MSLTQSKSLLAAPTLSVLSLIAVAFSSFGSWAKPVKQLTLPAVTQWAIEQDLWFESTKYKKQELENKAKAAEALPDPTIGLQVANLPLDTLSLDQEPMTQLKISAKQVLPRGNSRAIAQQKLSLAATGVTVSDQVRAAQVKRQVAKLFLQAYSAQQTLKLIDQDALLFEQMIDIAQANYANGLNQTRQQDVIQAQVERVKLQTRKIQMQENKDFALAQLSQWVPLSQQQNYELVLPQSKRDKGLQQTQRKLKNLASGPISKAVYQLVAGHPELRLFDVQGDVATKDVEMAEQSYKPQWTISASYGKREDNLAGQDRADLFSVGVAFDLPLFTGAKQDLELAAAKAKRQAIGLDKNLKLKQLASGFQAEIQRFQGLVAQQALYRDQLLSQLHQRTEAALTAYTNDDGSFDQVLSARSEELDSKIALLQIRVKVLTSLVNSQYFLTQYQAGQSLGGQQ